MSKLEKAGVVILCTMILVQAASLVLLVSTTFAVVRHDPRKVSGQWAAAPSRRFLNYEIRWESEFGNVYPGLAYFGNEVEAEYRAQDMNELGIDTTFYFDMPVSERVDYKRRLDAMEKTRVAAIGPYRSFNYMD